MKLNFRSVIRCKVEKKKITIKRASYRSWTARNHGHKGCLCLCIFRLIKNTPTRMYRQEIIRTIKMHAYRHTLLYQVSIFAPRSHLYSSLFTYNSVCRIKEIHSSNLLFSEYLRHITENQIWYGLIRELMLSSSPLFVNNYFHNVILTFLRQFMSATLKLL